MFQHATHDRSSISPSPMPPPALLSRLPHPHPGGHPAPAGMHRLPEAHSQRQHQPQPQVQSPFRPYAEAQVHDNFASADPISTVIPRLHSLATVHLRDQLPDVRPTKRPRIDSSRTHMSYPRKRAVTACHLCRIRKTKCSNERPRCKSCADTGVDCVYEDPLTHSSFDPASLLILDRLNQLLDRFDSVAGPAASSNDVSSIPQSHTFPSYISPASRENETARDDSRDDCMRTPSCRTTCDTMLTWPIFGNQYSTAHILGPLLSASQHSEDGLQGDIEGGSRTRNAAFGSRNTARLNAGMLNVPVEENVARLVENFIALVHTKNPILDISTLRRYARYVAENGPGWDGQTCLVLLTCALGAIAKPFPGSLDTSSPSVEFDMSAATSMGNGAHDLQLGAYYFSLARKRIGLMDSTIIRSQCYLLSGIYFMYTLQPLDAWQDFVQASTNCYISLQGHVNSAGGDTSDARLVRRARRLEQSLYWTCFKSECEIRVELSLPESILADVQYPDLFPSPPSEEAVMSPAPSTGPSDLSPYHEFASPLYVPSSRRTESMGESQEHSWYYYLTEIALRRIGNRILNALYSDANAPGNGIPVAEMLTIAIDFEKQLDEWQSNLPPSLAYSRTNLDETPRTELAYMIRSRTLEIQCWLYRPFLYYAIHHPEADPYQAVIEPFVKKALVYGSAIICGIGLRHRHHGIWYGLRAGTAATLSILAAVKSGVVDVGGDANSSGQIGQSGWAKKVRDMIEILGGWEAETPDLGKAKAVLCELLKELEDTP